MSQKRIAIAKNYLSWNDSYRVSLSIYNKQCIRFINLLQELIEYMINPTHKRFRLYRLQDIDSLPQLAKLSSKTREAMQAVASVLPFQVNNYVVEELIDWNNIPNDPIFRLTFPHPEMLPEVDLIRMTHLLQKRANLKTVREAANEIRWRLNPHPDGQIEHNIPTFNNKPLQGVQHKYRQTVLIFPATGQHCHSYCTFCFRWPQFVGLENLKFAARESDYFQNYLQEHQEVTDVLLTGGDPMTMNAKILARYIEPLLQKEFDHIQTIRIGTKSIAYWPYRYVTDTDADDVLRLFEKVVRQGKHLTIMGHYSHWRELETKIAREAIQRIRGTGAQIRTQAPIIRHINDSPEVWAKMWQMQVRLGCIPYYMFVERQTGAKDYFAIPLVRVFNIYRQAIQKVSGLGKTVRGPIMSTLLGKIQIIGISEIQQERVFVLEFLQARNPEWCKRPFFARFDANATWLDDPIPAFGEKRFFFENQLELSSEHDCYFLSERSP